MVSRVIVPVSAPITPSAVRLEHLSHCSALELAQLGQLDLANETDSKSNKKRATEIGKWGAFVQMLSSNVCE